MIRREFLAASGTLLVASMAGCSGDGDESGDDPILDETVTEFSAWQLELSAGDEVSIELTNEDGEVATAEVRTPDGAHVTTRDARSSVEFTVAIEQSGKHPVSVQPYGEATITATVE